MWKYSLQLPVKISTFGESDGRISQTHTLADVNECTEGTHTCFTNTKCTDIDGGYYCNCTEGFARDRHGNGQLCERIATETTVTVTNDSVPLPVDFIAALAGVLLSLILIV